MVIECKGLGHEEINEEVMKYDVCTLNHVLGQRFIGAGMKDKDITVEGVGGNALGAYLDGARIIVHGNGQDTIGDTMNDGEIVIDGNAGDCLGYAMRGGKIFVRGSAGYRIGIHMKAYKEKHPVIIIGGSAGSFLGEYMAGGTIIILGLDKNETSIISDYPGAGMHGGKIYVRSKCKGITFPEQVSTHIATVSDLQEIEKDLKQYCDYFSLSLETMMNSTFTVLTPNSSNPYRQLYVAN